MDVVRTYTPAEAAALSEVGVKAVHNAIDKKIVEGRSDSCSVGIARRVLSEDDLLRLKLWYGVGSTLAADRRQRLFEAIKIEPSAKTVRADDLLIVDVARARAQLAHRVRQLDEAESIIHRVKGVLGGEPVFKGTRVPVRMVVAMLAQGAGASEILAGYPSLTARMIDLAELWVAAHPARGRPKIQASRTLGIDSSKRVILKGDPQSRMPGTGV